MFFKYSEEVRHELRMISRCGPGEAYIINKEEKPIATTQRTTTTNSRVNRSSQVQNFFLNKKLRKFFP